MKRTAIITGASSGIGREFVRTLSSHGVFEEVWIIARNEERLLKVKKEISLPARVIPMDLTDPEFIPAMKQLLNEEKPDVRLLINASGYGKFQATERTSLEDNLGMIDLNCRALVAMTLITLPYMRRGAKIIEIASVAAYQPIPYINLYGASKAFVLSFTRALRREIKPRGIQVMALCPFWTRTAFFERAIPEDEEPVVKSYAAMYEPEYVVRCAWRALSWKQEYCIPGWIAKFQVLAVKILPHRIVMDIWMKQQKLKGR